MKRLKKVYLLIFLSLIAAKSIYACSMFKITEAGKTIVGNNEDWISANAEIWFEPAKEGKFGVAYVGFINHFPQGAINEAGLVFDVFVTDYLPVENTQGKQKVRPLDVTHQIMRNLENVYEVKAYFEKIDLSYMAGGVYMFVDKKGDYLIVEGDLLTIGHEAYYVQSNFIPSVNPSPQDVKNVDHYQKGIEFVQNYRPERTMSYCASVMNSMQQETTQYTSIYDLSTGTIELYHYHNYEHVIRFNLAEELGKGVHAYNIPELFPAKTLGAQYYQKFNDANNPARFMKDLWEKDSKGKQGEELEQFKEGFAWVLNTIGYEWMNDKKDAKGAIAIFRFGLELFPENAHIYKSLGEAYTKEEKYTDAIVHYAKSLSLNPKSLGIIEKLQEIRMLEEKEKQPKE